MIEQEQRTSHPPDTPVDERQLEDHQRIVAELGLLFRRLHAIHQGMRRTSGEPPLERTAYGLLSYVRHHGPVRPSAVAEAMRLDLSTVSRQVAALETAGWLERQVDPADRRASLIQLTETGRTGVTQQLTRLCDAMRGSLAGWDAADRQELVRLLAKFNDTIADRGAGTSPRTDW